MVYNTGNSGLPNNSIWDLAIGAQGIKWIGTLSGGLAKFDGQNWTVYNTSNSGLPDNNIYSLAIDVQANVWIGTQGGGLAVYRAGAQPTVDFNGDGIVDRAYMCIMVDHWGTDEPLYDIAPIPWGDGIVDVQDLVVLAEYLFTDLRLVAHWKLDETEGSTAHDSAGDHDGTINGEPLWQPAGGQVNGALAFNGIDDYVSVDFVLNPADGQFSVFAWIKGGAPGQVIFSQIGQAIWICADPSGGNLMTQLEGVGRSGRALTSQTPITDGDWHHVGLTWNGSNRILFIDDLEVAKDTQAQLGSSKGGLYIGAGKNLEPGSFFSGLIDDVRIYDRAITP
jgi:hypothetical protein